MIAMQVAVEGQSAECVCRVVVGRCGGQAAQGMRLEIAGGRAVKVSSGRGREK